MIRAVVFAAIVGSATWVSNIYDRYIRREDTDDE